MHVIHMDGGPVVCCDKCAELVPFMEYRNGAHECLRPRFGDSRGPTGFRVGMVERERLLAQAQARVED